jgi:hypothetical protein
MGYMAWLWPGYVPLRCSGGYLYRDGLVRPFRSFPSERDRGFESGSLQRRVRCELDFRGQHAFAYSHPSKQVTEPGQIRSTPFASGDKQSRVNLAGT